MECYGMCTTHREGARRTRFSFCNHSLRHAVHSPYIQSLQPSQPDRTDSAPSSHLAMLGHSPSLTVNHAERSNPYPCRRITHKYHYGVLPLPKANPQGRSKSHIIPHPITHNQPRPTPLRPRPSNRCKNSAKASLYAFNSRIPVTLPSTVVAIGRPFPFPRILCGGLT
jgi:hypothetical protein